MATPAVASVAAPVAPGAGSGGAGGATAAARPDDAVSSSSSAGRDPSGDAERTGPEPAPRPARWTRSWWAALVPLPRLPLAGMVLAIAAADMVGAPGPAMLGVVAVLAVIDALLVGGPWRLEVARRLPAAVTLGESATVAWDLRGSRRWPQRVDLADDLPPSLGAVRRVSATVRLDRTTTVGTPLQPTRRATHRPDEVVVRVAGPLRLVARQHARSVPGRIDVLPAFPSRRDAELRITDRRVLEAGVRSARLVGAGTEFESLRDYTPDDQVRRVDWSATARAGKPIVRTYRVERNQTVQVVLDTGRHSAGLVAGTTRLEHLMDAALAVTTVATGVGDKVGFQAFATDVHLAISPSGDRRQRSRVASAMAGLEPLLVESDYGAAFTDIVVRQRRRALLVVLTDLSSEALVDTLVPALPVLLASHLVVVGAVVDPEVTGWIDQPGASVDDAYLAAGAATLQRARRRTARLLTQRGAIVVDEPPDRLAGRLMDTYLDLKARGRL